jgi:hypothetical protein
MMQSKRKWIISILLMLVLGVMPVAAQVVDAPEPTPTIEVVETDVPTVPVVDEAPGQNFGTALFDFFKFAIENQLHWYVFAIIALLVAGNLVPQDEIKRRREQAKATETPIDDVLLAILDGIQTLKGNVSVPPPAPVPIPTDPLPTQPEPLPRGIPLNRNYTLDAIGDNKLSFYEETYDGRKVAIPHGYKYRAQPGMIGTTRSPNPDIFYKQAAGFEASIAYKAGRFGYSFTIPDNFVLGARQRFAIIVSYEANYAPMVGTDGNPTLYLDGMLTGNQPAIMLPSQVVIDGMGEAQWVLQTDEEVRGLVVTVGMYIPWAVIGDNSTLTIKSIKFVPVADDYGDVVIAV